VSAPQERPRAVYLGGIERLTAGLLREVGVYDAAALLEEKAKPDLKVVK
jgi:hypothetical protein